jgi:phytoene dehydrogenase-like protein
MEADSIHTIVVGAGIAGITAANEIAKKGHRVLVL